MLVFFAGLSMGSFFTATLQGFGSGMPQATAQSTAHWISSLVSHVSRNSTFWPVYPSSALQVNQSNLTVSRTVDQITAQKTLSRQSTFWPVEPFITSLVNQTDFTINPALDRIPAQQTLSENVKRHWGSYFRSTYGQDWQLSSHFGIGSFVRQAACIQVEARSQSLTSAVLVSLVAGPGIFGERQKALENWYSSLLHQFPFDVVLFVSAEQNIPDLLKTYSPVWQIKFPNVSITIESTLLSNSRKHMNVFLGHKIYSHPALRKYDYIWRLDSDATFLNVVHHNPVAEMMSSGKLVGWTVLGMPEIGMRLNEAVAAETMSWALCHGTLFRPNLYANYGAHDTIMAGPFEILPRRLFDSAQYTAWFRGIVLPKLSAIAHDQVREQYFKTLWIQLMVPPVNTLYLCEIGIHHKIPFPARCTLKAPPPEVCAV
jgi:hypothetical protein